MKPYFPMLIVLLLVTTSFAGVSYTAEELSTTQFDGNILYVGGSGEGNYTKIQDAINDANPGDTVFVYAYSSPYYENLIVDKSISMIGEDKDTTVIEGDWVSEYVVEISADWVNISGFTIRYGGEEWEATGILSISNFNTISGNNISNNDYYGIRLYYSSGNTITDNTISNNKYGIDLYESSGNTITGNNISNNKYGIYLDESSSNTITDNTISNKREGILLFSSNNNNILGNSFFNDGLFVYDSYDNNVENNTVNGKPLVYLEDESDKVIDYEVGQVILVNCDNIIAENLNLSNTDHGIELWKTDNSMIRNNDFSNNERGIYIRLSNSNNITGNNISNNKRGISFGSYSNSNNITGNNISSNGHAIIFWYRNSNNTITDNTLSNNDYSCIRLDCSSGNTITGNNISNNEYGIYLDESSNNNNISGNNISNNGHGIRLSYSTCNNTITGNNISNNGYYGICLYYSSDNNIIYHNNFINNTNNSYDGCNNIWDDGKYGNYWSDYKEKYPDAKKKRWKGIWDTPYEIEGGDNKDNYPLINQYPKSVIKTKSRDKPFNYNFPILNWLFEQFSNVFTILKYFLKLYNI